jgi:hypothetical protein
MGQTTPNKTFEQVRAELTDGQVDALLRKLARSKTGDESCVGDVLYGVLRGDFGIELRDLVVKLFDVNGRFIPPVGFKGPFVNANRQFHTVQPTAMKGNAIVAACKKVLPGLKFGTGKDLDVACAKLREQVEAIPQVRNILRGPCFNLQLPQMVIADQGTTLEEVILPGVERAYLKAFPDRQFNNYRKGELKGEVKVVDASHNRLIDMMSQGPVNVLYFPNSLQGFGIEADREAMQHLPPGFTLCGAVDTGIALMAYPKVLARDYYTPVLDCAAVSWRSSFSLYFGPDDYHLDFDNRDLDASDLFSGGVLFVGQ